MACILAEAALTAGAQLPAPPDAPAPQIRTGSHRAAKSRSQHRIFWVIPNYRSDENSTNIQPLPVRGKFKVAIDDSFDPSAFLVAGVFAGMAMAQNQYAPFGHGAAGFGEYYGGAFADQAIGNMMSEAVFPSVLHQDPRYFVKGRGGFWKRTGYAISREVITQGDDGHAHFNTSEVVGNAVAAGISNVYYPSADRSAANTTTKWEQQLALDTVFNVMKEFWPDVRRKMFGQ
jgi:hypothetical protein